jgi:hypothetical protein
MAFSDLTYGAPIDAHQDGPTNADSRRPPL